MVGLMFIVALGVFLLLFGVFKVTNIQVTWGEGIMGFAALVAGVLAIASVVMGSGVLR